MHGYPRIVLDSRRGRKNRLILKAVRSNQFVERNNFITIWAFDMKFPFVLRIISLDLGDGRLILDVFMKFVMIRIRSEMRLQVSRRWTERGGFERVSLKDHVHQT